MNAAQLNGEIAFGVYVADGEDAYWLSYVEKTFRNLVGEDSFSLFVFDALDTFDEVVGALDTVSFSDDSNVVIVKASDYKLTDADKKKLEKLEVTDAYLLFVNPKFLGAKEKKRFTVIDCNKTDKYRCMDYAKSFFSAGIDGAALSRLVEYTDCDMARIKTEAKKLSDYCDGRKVTLQDIEDTVAEDAELQIYMFASAITEGKKTEAVRLLNKLKKRGEAPGYLLASLIGQYRRMLHAGLSNKSDAELAELLKVKEYAVKKARQTRKMSKRQLKDTLEMLVSYETKFKTGEMSDRTAFDAAVGRLLGEEAK